MLKLFDTNLISINRLSGAFFSKFVALLLVFLFATLTPLAQGIVQFGELVLLLSINYVAGCIFAFGFQRKMLILAEKIKSDSNLANLNFYFFVVLLFLIILALILYFGITLSGLNIYLLQITPYETLLVFCLCGLLRSLLLLQSQILVGLGHGISSIFVSQIFVYVSLISMNLGTIFFNLKFKSEDMILFSLIFSVLISFLLYVSKIRTLKIAIPHKFETFRFNELASIWVSEIITTLQMQTHIIILGAMSEYRSISIFYSIEKLSKFSSIAEQLCNRLFSNKIAKLYRKKLNQKLSFLAGSIANLTLTYNFMYFALILFFGEFMLQIFFGDEFAMYKNWLMVVCGAYFLKSIFGISQQLLIISKNPQLVFLSSLIVFIISSLITYFLFFEYGFVSAFIGFSVSIILSGLLPALMVSKKFKIISFPRRIK